MKRKPKMNVKLLRRIQRWLMRLRHPEHFNMADYWRKGDCGTSYCIAGKALQLSGYRLGHDMAFSLKGRKGRFIRPIAESLLWLTPDEAHRLFYKTNWPYQFLHSSDPKSAAKRIEHFIETDGKE
mgnify:CR=1 FL=1